MIWRAFYTVVLIIGAVLWVLIWFGGAALIYWWFHGR